MDRAIFHAIQQFLMGLRAQRLLGNPKSDATVATAGEIMNRKVILKAFRPSSEGIVQSIPMETEWGTEDHLLLLSLRALLRRNPDTTVRNSSRAAFRAARKERPRGDPSYHVSARHGPCLDSKCRGSFALCGAQKVSGLSSHVNTILASALIPTTSSSEHSAG